MMAEDAADSALELKRNKILLVDDAPENLRILSECLRDNPRFRSEAVVQGKRHAPRHRRYQLAGCCIRKAAKIGSRYCQREHR